MPDLESTLLDDRMGFFSADGASHIPSALKAYKAKVVSTLSFAVLLWATMSNLTPLKTLQNQFLHHLLKLPPCVMPQYISSYKSCH
ncbi:hypothetical protein JRQ81_013398 [Phrynocephalus forsythii]|uniref:Uncharacterized protein n=1 Tax=Phrynocephalus forsythii TaxID=171643 RepID=A0A9Q0Y038_9SAUR|nr:hypothetical protein JRQ81_013398 [Phrynocephalus forsythii]